MTSVKRHADGQSRCGISDKRRASLPHQHSRLAGELAFPCNSFHCHGIGQSSELAAVGPAGLFFHLTKTFARGSPAVLLVSLTRRCIAPGKRS